MQNGNCEAFNGRMHVELPSETLFFGIDHAREAIARWTHIYNTELPHSAFGYQAPAVLAAQLTARAIRFAHLKSAAERPSLRRRNCAKFNHRPWPQLDEHRGSQQCDRETQIKRLRGIAWADKRDQPLSDRITWRRFKYVVA